MPVESDDDLAVFYNADEFALAAVYTPPAGAPVACTVLLDRHDSNEPGDATPRAGVASINVRASEIALPVAGGAFLVDGTTYTVIERPRLNDAAGTEWTMWVA